jgi:hypothetical protein
VVAPRAPERYGKRGAVIDALRTVLRDPEARRSAGLLAGTAIVAPFVFMWLEGWSFSKAVTFALIGLIQALSGTELPRTVGGRIFALAYVVVVLGSALALIQSLTPALLNSSADPDESGGR